MRALEVVSEEIADRRQEPQMFYAWFAAAAWALPTLVMVASYVAIALHTGNPSPWRELVHESARGR
jgi:hypothetical protein